ncbi:MAG: Crp/Fnr family transcriptional regulator [Pseudanabaena sp. ELA607]
MNISFNNFSKQPTHFFPLRSFLSSSQDTLWQIEQGIVRSLTLHEDGTTVALGLWGPGDIIGQPLSRLIPYQMECLSIVRAKILRSCDWQFDANVLVPQIEQLEALTVIRSYRRVDIMVVRLLKWLSDKFGRNSELGRVIDLRLTHQDIADLLGTTRVTVTRILKQLEEQGMIERPSIHHILIKEEEFWYYQI